MTQQPENTETATNADAATSLADGIDTLIEKTPGDSIEMPKHILRKLVGEYREAISYMPPGDALNFAVEAEQHNGVRIPMRVILHYPENHGIYAVEVLKALPQYTMGVLKDMVAKNDESVIRALGENAEKQQREDAAGA